MSSNASSPPSAFTKFAEASSSSLSTPRSKPRSLNIVSPSTSNGPRPLHLVQGSVVGNSPSPHPGPDSAVNDTGESRANPSPRQLPLPLSPTITGLRPSSSRRQSSISYLPARGHSPSHSQTNFSKRDSIENLSLGLARSPLSSSYATTTFSVEGGKSPGLARSSSLGGRRSKTLRSPAIEERSRSSTDSIRQVDGLSNVKERPPVTLAEKHSELLHFIAQKESKCLELRSQLAVHEAELSQLKKKWERIVNRGFEKSLSTNTTLSPSPPQSSSLSPGFSSSTSNESSATNNSSYFPTLTPTANASSTIVLEGIKEGVQGMSRLLAAGLGSIAQVNAPQNTNDIKGPITPEPHTSPVGPIPFRLGSASQRKSHGIGHEQKESQSSSSTTTSAASNATFSSLLSASSTSSATTAASSSTSLTSGNTTTQNSVTEESVESDSEFGEFEDGQAGGRAVVADRGQRKEEAHQEQVLMVRDTGATPTMSPNPDFQRRKRKTKDELEVQDLPSTSNVDTADSDMKIDFDWDDGWDEPEVADPPRNVGECIVKSAFAAQDRTQDSMHASSALAPIASIPGLTTVGMAASTPSAQKMSSWVGSVGKKWVEIKGSDAFTKNQKRATLLLSDMQQSLVSALISPSSEPSSLHPAPTPTSSPLAFSSNAFHQQPPLSLSSKTTAKLQPAVQRPVSFIDDSDDESFGEGAETDADNTVRLTMAAPVMVPTAVTQVGKIEVANGATRTNHGSTSAKAPKIDDAEDDEWNW